ncbi:MAG: transposase [Paenibacillus sp.]|jgi:hypothetical protein|nr:transposase [Paenibacillus sp.]
MDYISPKEASLSWSISERRTQKLCEEGRINGVVRFSKVWAIPKDTIIIPSGLNRMARWLLWVIMNMANAM